MSNWNCGKWTQHVTVAETSWWRHKQARKIFCYCVTFHSVCASLLHSLRFRKSLNEIKVFCGLRTWVSLKTPLWLWISFSPHQPCIFPPPLLAQSSLFLWAWKKRVKIGQRMKEEGRMGNQRRKIIPVKQNVLNCWDRQLPVNECAQAWEARLIWGDCKIPSN